MFFLYSNRQIYNAVSSVPCHLVTIFSKRFLYWSFILPNNLLIRPLYFAIQQQLFIVFLKWSCLKWKEDVHIASFWWVAFFNWGALEVHLRCTNKSIIFVKVQVMESSSSNIQFRNFWLFCLFVLMFRFFLTFEVLSMCFLC